MVGRQLDIASTGASYEATFSSLADRIASVTSVPRPHDFGIDFYCQPRLPLDERTETVRGLFGVQVKGGQQDQIEFGGKDRNFEIDWLRSLAAPLFIVRVDANHSYADFYSLHPIWPALIEPRPSVKIICTTLPYAENTFEYRNPSSEERDGETIWRACLGPPFLRLTHDGLNAPARKAEALHVLSVWLAVERISLVRFNLGINVFQHVLQWRTNAIGILGAQMYWSAKPGPNTGRLAESLSPGVTNLGAHLQWQDDPAAYRLIPFLEWLRDQGALDGFGFGLLEGLLRTQSQGLPPKPRKP
jgi:hypothetical protein